MSESFTPNTPDGLLAALVPYGVLRQPEVAVTVGIGWVLGLPGAASALDQLVSRRGPSPQHNGSWRSEVVGDGGRTDLEYWWGGPPAPRVVVEAKLEHALSADQLLGYTSRVEARNGLVAVLVPASRRAEAERVVAQCQGGDLQQQDEDRAVSFDVWTYDEVADALRRAMPASGDVAQLASLMAAHSALDIPPFTDVQLLDDDPSRLEDLWRVVDAASFGIGGTRLPSGSDGSLQHRRYVAVGPYSVGFAVGVGRTVPSLATSPAPWSWIRVGGDDGYSLLAQKAVQQLHPDTYEIADRATWIPLDVPTGVYGHEATDLVRESIERTTGELRLALDEEVRRRLAAVPEPDRAAASAVLAVEAFSPSELSDDCATRRDDIWMLLTEASRSLYPGRIFPAVSSDGDFELVRYVPLPPSDAYVAVCLGRRQPVGSDASQPWAWVRVHKDTQHAEIGARVLDEVRPGGVQALPNGPAMPLDIPSEVDGPQAMLAVHAQLSELVSRFTERIAAEA